MRTKEGTPELLVMRIRASGYELPKGHLEGVESAEEAAIRELLEETGLMFSPEIHAPIGYLDYSFRRRTLLIQKRVHYFVFIPRKKEHLTFGDRPAIIRELRWISEREVPSLPLVSEQLRPVLDKAFEIFRSQPSRFPL
ncbi:ADP-ribose pyrophosphatase [Planctomycetales bacterium 10988]|nr:ADP-ribose pyrophosphatase [Planctomycetales bacterium 10988]